MSRLWTMVALAVCGVTVVAGQAPDRPFHSAELIFPLEHWHNHSSCVVEAANGNWVDQKASVNPRYAAYIFLARLGARHGKVTADGANAFTNMAFFDGHVALYPTEPFTRKSGTDNALIDFYRDTIFYINKQKGK